MTVAADHYRLDLRIGRRLSGWWLAVAVLLREIPLMILFASGPSNMVAPSWVLITEKSTGRRVGKAPAGRDPHAGQELLVAMQRDAALLSPGMFVNKWTSQH